MSNDYADGILVFMGAGLGILLTLLITCSSNSPKVVNAYAELREQGIHITITDFGNFYLWDEKTQSSIKVDNYTLQGIAQTIKKK